MGILADRLIIVPVLRSNQCYSDRLADLTGAMGKLSMRLKAIIKLHVTRSTMPN